VRARADGDAYASLKVATAQAEALKIQNAALAQNRMCWSYAGSKSSA
jgi:prohibitin 2